MLASCFGLSTLWLSWALPSGGSSSQVEDLGESWVRGSRDKCGALPAVCQGLVATAGLGWGGVCGAGPCLARARLNCAFTQTCTWNISSLQSSQSLTLASKKKENRARIACMLLIPEASHCKSDQNFDHNIWNKHHTNGSRESIIWPASDEVQSYSVGSNLNQYKIPQNFQRDLAILPTLYWCTTKWN